MSLVLSGVLTGVLVGNLEEARAQQQLDQAIPSYRLTVERLECAAGVTAGNTPACPGVNPTKPVSAANPEAVNSRAQYLIDLRNNIQLLPDDRLLLVGSDWRILYDSLDPLPVDSVPAVANGNRTGNNIVEATLTLGKNRYLAAAVPLLAASRQHDPLRAQWVVLARSRSAIAAQATGLLLPRLLEAGGVALIFAMVVTLLLSQAMVRPLGELVRAAEDLAAGNYSRRVRAGGGDEIGVLGRAFNRMAEAVEKARAMQRDFLANVSHELKTPLTSLIGFSQALVDGSLQTDAERQRAAGILHEEAVRVLRMSQELLDLARVEGGHLSLRQSPVDLGDMLAQEIDIVRQRADAKRLALVLEMDGDLPPVKADPERLHQILENLLDNAVKYTPSGNQVVILAHEVPEGVETMVSNPVGPHPPDPDRMFERFYRADPSRSSGAGGVGLGLSISRELAAAQLGRLWADFDADGRLRMHLLLQSGPRSGPARDPNRITGHVERLQRPTPEPATTRLTPPG